MNMRDKTFRNNKTFRDKVFAKYGHKKIELQRNKLCKHCIYKFLDNRCIDWLVPFCLNGADCVYYIYDPDAKAVELLEE